MNRPNERAANDLRWTPRQTGGRTFANAKLGPDAIAFNLPPVTRIAPLTPLPAITERVTIDGFTQAGLPQATRPLIELDGSQLAVGAPGPAAKGATAQPVEEPQAKATRASDDGVIRFLRPWGLDLRNADGSTIRGLIVHDFPYAQIGLDGTDQATLTGNWLGLTPTGDAQTRTSTADPRLGLSLINSAQATIGGIGRDENVISGNDYGITLTDAGSGANVILGNYLGATTGGLGRRPNRETGILLTEPVGTTGRGTRENVLAGNVVLGDGESYGISVLAATKTSVLGNFVGLNAAGQAKSPTGEPLGHDIGVYVHDSPETEIGGSGAAEFNLVGGNLLGVELNGGSNDSKLVGNRSGTDYDGQRRRRRLAQPLRRRDRRRRRERGARRHDRERQHVRPLHRLRPLHHRRRAARERHGQPLHAQPRRLRGGLRAQRRRRARQPHLRPGQRRLRKQAARRAVHDHEQPAPRQRRRRRARRRGEHARRGVGTRRGQRHLPATRAASTSTRTPSSARTTSASTAPAPAHTPMASASPCRAARRRRSAARSASTAAT